MKIVSKNNRPHLNHPYLDENSLFFSIEWSIIIKFWIILVIHCWMIVAENQFNPKMDVL